MNNYEELVLAIKRYPEISKCIKNFVNSKDLTASQIVDTLISICNEASDCNNSVITDDINNVIEDMNISVSVEKLANNLFSNTSYYRITISDDSIDKSHESDYISAITAYNKNHRDVTVKFIDVQSSSLIITAECSSMDIDQAKLIGCELLQSK